MRTTRRVGVLVGRLARLYLRWHGVSVGRGLRATALPNVQGDGHHIHIGDDVFLQGKVELWTRGSGRISIGNEVKLDRGVRLVSPDMGHISVADRARIGVGTIVNCGTSIEIGEAVLISGYCYIQGSEHGLVGQEGVSSSAFRKAAVRIHDGSWLGAHSSVLLGVEVGRGAVIGAHSLVRKDVPEFHIVAGVPAKSIRSRLDQG